jgi:hypothetical protein
LLMGLLRMEFVSVGECLAGAFELCLCIGVFDVLGLEDFRIGKGSTR